MSILQDKRFRWIVFLVTLSCVFMFILKSAGYCSNWVLIKSYDDFTNYYDSSSVKITKQDKIINVLVKDVYTSKGKTDKLNKIGDIVTRPIEYDIVNLSFNYNDNSYNLIKLTYYSKSGDELTSNEFQSEWEKLIPGSRMDFLLNKLLEDCNIRR